MSLVSQAKSVSVMENQQILEDDNLGFTFRTLKSSSNQKTYAKGTYIYQEGDIAQGFYKVLKGRVKLLKRNKKTNRSIIFYFVHSSDFFGILENFDNSGVHRCSAIAVDKNVVVQYIPFYKLLKHMQSDPSRNLAIIQYLIKKCEINWEKYCELQNGDITKRVFKAIQKMAIVKGEITKRGVLIKGVNHQELADYIGSSRTTVAGVMNKFRKEKKIEYNRNYILIKN